MINFAHARVTFENLANPGGAESAGACDNSSVCAVAKIPNLERKIGGDIELHDETASRTKCFSLARCLHNEFYVAVRRILFAYRHAKIHGGPQQARAAHLLGLQALDVPVTFGWSRLSTNTWPS